ncbi:MAG: tryptophan 7-halogenase [Gammaproteobacteria bacterium]|nr:tryptophan 7-halogenase [Gammaproteobacteria bacterium]NNJ72138.1 hypothetical protein [Enterobacterales bacterium]
MNKKPQKIMIVGQHAEAWVTAALYAKSLAGVEITILGKQNSDPATYNLAPENMRLLQHLDITEQNFLKQTAGCFNLGSLFLDWCKSKHNYFQPFGGHGVAMDYVGFQHYAIKQHLSGTTIRYEDYSLTAQAARQNKFARPKMDSQSILATMMYAHTVNGLELVNSLRAYVEALGVTIIDADISEVLIGEESGIEALVDDTGKRHVADLYLDCSAENRTLISALPGYDNESFAHYFKVDSKVQWRTAKAATTANHAIITAKENGWLRELSDQRQTMKEYYFNSKAETTEDALAICQAHGLNSDNHTVTESSCSSVEAPWLANCVALGSAAAYFEPLDVSSLNSLITDAFRLLELFPRSASWTAQQYEYNRKTRAWYDNLCNMNIHRYRALAKSANLTLASEDNLPETVQRKIELFLDNGQIAYIENEPFTSSYQIAMFLGLDIWPTAYDPLLDNFDIKTLEARFKQMQMDIDKVLAFMPKHDDFLTRDLAS